MVSEKALSEFACHPVSTRLNVHNAEGLDLVEPRELA